MPHLVYLFISDGDSKFLGNHRHDMMKFMVSESTVCIAYLFLLTGWSGLFRRRGSWRKYTPLKASISWWLFIREKWEQIKEERDKEIELCLNYPYKWLNIIHVLDHVLIPILQGVLCTWKYSFIYFISTVNHLHQLCYHNIRNNI